ncbi:MAG TPA: ABC transporter permease [Vicinamibacteria bacterium]|nr:ABC transporter permease [Vicinamibacteria bacterium]
MSRDTSRPLPLLAGVRAIFSLSLEGMAWTRRNALMALLLGLPALFALLYRVTLAAQLPASVSPLDLYGSIVALYYVRNAVPLAALFYATSLIADEVEDRTITYLLTRPVGRASILLGKYAAYAATTLSLALPALAVSFLLLATARGLEGLRSGLADLPRDLGAVALGLLAYGGLFALMGVVLRRPVIPGLLFLFVWEMLANLPGYLPRFTLTAWLRSLVGHRPPEEGLLAQLFTPAVLPPATSLAVLAVATAACVALAVAIFARREYVLEQ